MGMYTDDLVPIVASVPGPKTIRDGFRSYFVPSTLS